MKKALSPRLKNKKGFAVIEAVMVLFIFLILMWYSIGFFGVIHTGILHSIAARNYTFETFRHRSNLWFFRSNTTSIMRYHAFDNRVHGTNSEIVIGGSNKLQYATERRVAMFKGDIEPTGRSPTEHAQAMGQVKDGERNTSVSLDPVWIKVQYGICLTAGCGG